MKMKNAIHSHSTVYLCRNLRLTWKEIEKFPAIDVSRSNIKAHHDAYVAKHFPAKHFPLANKTVSPAAVLRRLNAIAYDSRDDLIRIYFREAEDAIFAKLKI